MHEPEPRPMDRSDEPDTEPEAGGPAPVVRPGPEVAAGVDPYALAGIARSEWMRPRVQEHSRWWVRGLWFTAAAGIGMGFALLLASFH